MVTESVTSSRSSDNGRSEGENENDSGRSDEGKETTREGSEQPDTNRYRERDETARNDGEGKPRLGGRLGVKNFSLAFPQSNSAIHWKGDSSGREKMSETRKLQLNVSLNNFLTIPCQFCPSDVFVLTNREKKNSFFLSNNSSSLLEERSSEFATTLTWATVAQHLKLWHSLAARIEAHPSHS